MTTAAIIPHRDIGRRFPLAPIILTSHGLKVQAPPRRTGTILLRFLHTAPREWRQVCTGSHRPREMREPFSVRRTVACHTQVITHCRRCIIDRWVLRPRHQGCIILASVQHHRSSGLQRLYRCLTLTTGRRPQNDRYFTSICNLDKQRCFMLHWRSQYGYVMRLLNHSV